MLQETDKFSKLMTFREGLFKLSQDLFTNEDRQLDLEEVWYAYAKLYAASTTAMGKYAVTTPETVYNNSEAV
jgi:hypothetical protein